MGKINFQIERAKDFIVEIKDYIEQLRNYTDEDKENDRLTRANSNLDNANLKLRARIGFLEAELVKTKVNFAKRVIKISREFNEELKQIKNPVVKKKVRRKK